MDETNRVKNMKLRFENHAQEDTKQQSVLSKKTMSTAKTEKVNLTTDGPRSVIKRTPAFRKDKFEVNKNMKNESIVSNRVHQFNNLSNNGPLKSMENNLKRNANHDGKDVHSKLKKPIKSKIHEKHSTHFKTYEKQITVKVDDNLVHPRIQDRAGISDTLQKVLGSPLPAGPPPKKPPRTFAVNELPKLNFNNLNRGEQELTKWHVSKNSTIENAVSDSVKKLNRENNGVINRNKKADLNLNEKEFPKPNPCSLYRLHRNSVDPSKKFNSDSKFADKTSLPTRSKTEPEIKLIKMEKKQVKPQLSSFRSPRSNDDMLNSRIKKNDCSVKSLLCMSNDIIYDEPLVSNSQFFTNVTSENHIYEDPDSLKSDNGGENKGSLYYMSTPIDSLLNSPEPDELKTLPTLIEALNFAPKNTDNRGLVETQLKFLMDETLNQRWSRMSDTNSSDTESVLSITDESDSQSSATKRQTVELDSRQVTLERKGYVCRVASRTSFRSLSQPSVDAAEHLFDCLVLVGINIDGKNNKVPYIKMKYPNDVILPQSMEHLCFPDAKEWKNDLLSTSSEDDSECYTITLTTDTARRLYVYCRRVRPEGAAFTLPFAYCVVSSFKANRLYYQMLQQLEQRHGQTAAAFDAYVNDLYSRRFPLTSVSGRSEVDDGDDELTEVARHVDRRQCDLQLAGALQLLKVDVFLAMFSNLLLERSVILLSSSISKLSTVMEGIQMALLPFCWQHTLITVVPSSEISVCDLVQAPTPYLIGLLKSNVDDNNSSYWKNSFSKIQNLAVIDVDKSKMIQKVGDESSILPRSLLKQLKKALQQLDLSTEVRDKNVFACEAFTRLFVELIGHYTRYLFPSNYGNKLRIHFQKEAFVNATSITPSIRMFLVWFVDTAAFTNFINDRMASKTNPEVTFFEQRCLQFAKKQTSINQNNNNVQNPVKNIGDYFKELISPST